MKLSINYRMTAVITMLFVSLLTVSSCNNDKGKKCCEGYTGKITNPRADSLVNRCHFLSEESIKIWVGRYEEYKTKLDRNQGYKTNTGNNKDSLNAPMENANADLDKIAARFLRGGAVSFNSCIIKKLLCNENSIGLRVLYGIGDDNRIHIILVGIKPDYTNLYVEAEEECCTKSMTKALGAGLSGLAATSGGAEFGQMP